MNIKSDDNLLKCLDKERRRQVNLNLFEKLSKEETTVKNSTNPFLVKHEVPEEKKTGVKEVDEKKAPASPMFKPP